MGFLEGVYSYVFGDGDANAGLPERRLAAAAASVRAQGGVVAAEELAPFLHDPPASALVAAGSTVVDERWVLPLVLALGGAPVVTPEGDLAYAFWDLMASAAGPSAGASRQRQGRFPATAPSVGEPSTASKLMVEVLHEAEAPFSSAPHGVLLAAAALGLANLAGVLALGLRLSSAGHGNLVGGGVGSGVGVVGRALAAGRCWPLAAYALAFNALPLGRDFCRRRANRHVRRRNAVRSAWARRLADASGGASSTGSPSFEAASLARKLGAARAVGAAGYAASAMGAGAHSGFMLGGRLVSGEGGSSAHDAPRSPGASGGLRPFGASGVAYRTGEAAAAAVRSERRADALGDSDRRLARVDT